MLTVPAAAFVRFARRYRFPPAPATVSRWPLLVRVTPAQHTMLKLLPASPSVMTPFGLIALAAPRLNCLALDGITSVCVPVAAPIVREWTEASLSRVTVYVFAAPVLVMQASSAEVGTAPLDQLAGVLKLPSAAIHVSQPTVWPLAWPSTAATAKPAPSAPAATASRTQRRNTPVPPSGPLRRSPRLEASLASGRPIV